MYGALVKILEVSQITHNYNEYLIAYYRSGNTHIQGVSCSHVNKLEIQLALECYSAI